MRYVHPRTESLSWVFGWLDQSSGGSISERSKRSWHNNKAVFNSAEVVELADTPS